MKGIIINGSSRLEGNTKRIIEQLNEGLSFEVLDLSRLNLSAFDYHHTNRDDDFLPTMRNLVDQRDLIVFATPVYWYSMSGLMKNFFDRLTDCLTIEKETGRKLRGKHMAALSVGSDSNEVEGFFVPFHKSATYLGMQYAGDVHTWIENSVILDTVLERIDHFRSKLCKHFIAK